MKTKFIPLLLLLIPSFVQGELIEGLSIQSSTVGLNPEMGPEKAINGVGLDGDVPSLNSSHREQFSSNWWSGWSAAVTEWQITIDLEGNYDLNTIHIWNYREGCCAGRGLKDVEIYVSPDEDENNLVKLNTDGSGQHDSETTGNFLLPLGPTGGDYFGFDLDTSGVINSGLLDNVRLIRLDGGTSLHDEAQVHGGLAEIQFDGVPATEGQAPFQLSITTNEDSLDFSWPSKDGKIYDLVSSETLSIPIDQWSIVASNEDMQPTAPLNTLNIPFTDVPLDSKRFFAIIEKSED